MIPGMDNPSPAKVTPSEALDRATEAAGGVMHLAAAIGELPQTVSMWRKRGRVPAEKCIAVEKASGGAATRYDLRPDVFGDSPSPDGEGVDRAA